VKSRRHCVYHLSRTVDPLHQATPLDAASRSRRERELKEKKRKKAVEMGTGMRGKKNKKAGRKKLDATRRKAKN
jgi:hypothetical protein